jgi:YggT family protein
MFVVGNIIEGIALALRMLLDAYWWIIIIRALISWVNPDPYNPIVRFLYAATDPVLYRVRRWFPISFSGIDFSPILVLVAIYFLEIAVVKSLLQLAYNLQ